jgi:imidazolonepropionase-like amidohydrolase
MVRQTKAEGGDVIKIFATASIRDGGKQTMTDEQIAVVCGEAKAQGIPGESHASEARKGDLLKGPEFALALFYFPNAPKSTALPIWK